MARNRGWEKDWRPEWKRGKRKWEHLWGPARRERHFENGRRLEEQTRIKDTIRRAWKARQPKPPPRPKGPPRQAVCKNGHEWTEATTYLIPSDQREGNRKRKGERQCKLCMRDRVRNSARRRLGIPLDAPVLPSPPMRYKLAKEKLAAQMKAELEERRRWLLRPPMRGVSE